MTKGQFKIKNSLGMFDLLKGYVMIVMILHHTYEKTPVIEFIELHLPPFLVITLMPALFVVSGYGFRKTTFNKCIKKQWQTLIIPFLYVLLAVSIVHFLYYFIVYGGLRLAGLRLAITETAKLFVGTLFGLQTDTFFGFNILKCGPIWYLLALAIGNVIFNELVNRLEGKKLLLASTIVATAGWLIGRFIILPWCILQAMVATFFICVGYLAKKEKLFTDPDKRKTRIVSALIVFGISILGMLVGDGVEMAFGYYKYGILSIIVGGAEALLLIYCFLQLNRFDGKISYVIRYIGRLSLYVYCIHHVEFMGAGQYFQYDLVNRWKWHPALYSLLMGGSRLILVLVLTHLFIFVKEKITRKEIKE